MLHQINLIEIGNEPIQITVFTLQIMFFLNLNIHKIKRYFAASLINQRNNEPPDAFARPSVEPVCLFEKHGVPLLTVTVWIRQTVLDRGDKFIFIPRNYHSAGCKERCHMIKIKPATRAL